MQFQQIRYIIAIAEEKNITKAAEKLFISQSALSQQLQKLEQELGVELFVRTGKKLDITKAGQIYINAAKAILNIEQAFYNEVERMNKRTSAVRIAVCTHISSTTLERLIVTVCDKFKERSFELKMVGDITPKEGNQMLFDGKADVVIAPVETVDSLTFFTFATEEDHYILVSSKSPKTGETISVVLANESSYMRQLQKQALKKAGIKFEIAGTSEFISPALLAGGRSAFVSEYELNKTSMPYCLQVGYTVKITARCLLGKQLP